MTDRPVNFSAGPAILPQPVLAEASRAVEALPELGLSILEISHRSPTFEAILAETRGSLTRLLGIPDTHELLFLQGGARGQFAQVPLNFLGPEQRAAYVMTGVWSDYALEEAQRMGDAYVAASSKDENYGRLPDTDGLVLGSDVAYVHTTSNNTIYGTQFRELPDFGSTRHVCDMSSDILSTPVDVSRFGLIYAGAQKNCGPAGVTLVIVDKAWMASARIDIPTIWRYETHAKKSSMYNTPPTFAIYVVGLVAKWLEEMGGLTAMAKRNAQKAGLLYEAIESSDGFYTPNVGVADHRSRMNVTFRTRGGAAVDKRFVSEAAAAGLSGLKGHRLSGGLRASIYNAMPVEGVERLVTFMEGFAAQAG